MSNFRSGTAVPARAVLLSLTAAGCLLAGCASSGSGGAKSSPSVPAGSATVSASGSSASSASFHGVKVTGAADLTAKPRVTSASKEVPAALEVQDLTVGSGKAATPTSTVTVQYVGVRYADGKQFDASWDHGGATSFPLTQVVPGFTQGIGGNGTVPAMKTGGRRLMILPAALGYGSAGTPDGSIPPNAPIVFVVDLVGVN